MGMITLTDSLSLSMEQFAQNMVSLHHEIGSAQMQGETNFLVSFSNTSFIVWHLIFELLYQKI
jgi:hypothetical protein